MLAGLCHSLFSVLCFSFTNPDGNELREREKEKEKQEKIGGSPSYLTLLSIVPRQQTDRWASSSCLSLCWSVMYFKTLV
jgi:hypothetical protein